MSNNKQSMKLYTEEQVKLMIDDAHNGIDGYCDIFKKHIPFDLEKMLYETFYAGQESMEEGGKGFDQWYQETFGGQQ